MPALCQGIVLYCFEDIKIKEDIIFANKEFRVLGERDE